MPEVISPEERVFDRVPQFDERSKNFQIRSLLEAAVVPRKAPVSRKWRVGPTLDQGREGACVGFALTHHLQGYSPRSTGLSAKTAIELYHEAQKNDQWPGENYEGTSDLGGVKALVKRGYVTTYHWIGAGSQTVADDILDTLSYIGPIEFGIPYPRSGFKPRPSGLLEVDTKDIAGGHEIHARELLLGVQLPGETKKMDLIGFQQSWGTSFGVKVDGQGGFVYAQIADVEALMKMQGDGLVITAEKSLPWRV